MYGGKGARMCTLETKSSQSLAIIDPHNQIMEGKEAHQMVNWVTKCTPDMHLDSLLSPLMYIVQAA